MNWKVLNKNKIRELCYVVTVDDIRPIPGKDRVECAVVGGWTVMVRKDEFKVGEPGIYFEIDSRVPEKEPFLFLSKNKYKIKTQRYKTPEGAFYSQGLLMSAKDFGWILDYTIDSEVPFIADSDGNIHYVNDESRFLTEQLGITYAVQEDNERKAKPIDPYKKMCSRYPKVFSNPIIKWIYKRNWGKKLLFCFFGKDKQDSSKFPTHFPYIKVTNEERVENMLEILNDKSLFSYTVKIDGTSTTFILERKKNKKPFESPYEFYVCSRNKRIFNEDQQTYHELKGENDSGNVYWQMAKKYNIESVLTSILDTHPALDYVCIQGETAGVKLQGNPHKLPDVRFYAFNYIDSIKGLWESEDAYKFLAKYEIPFVPIISNSFILPDTLEEFKKQADGSISDYIPDAHGLREGFVYRKVGNPNISFKNVSREYLIKKGE